MKARVKATGDIIEVERIGIASDIWALQSDSTVVFDDEELDINIEPDYWEKLKHQYTGMAMQGLLSNSAYLENYVKYSVVGESFTTVVTENAVDYATALVNRFKEEQK